MLFLHGKYSQYRKQGNKDIRDVISLGKLMRKADGPDEIEAIMRTFSKYGGPMNEHEQTAHGIYSSFG